MVNSLLTEEEIKRLRRMLEVGYKLSFFIVLKLYFLSMAPLEKCFLSLALKHSIHRHSLHMTNTFCEQPLLQHPTSFRGSSGTLSQDGRDLVASGCDRSGSHS